MIQARAVLTDQEVNSPGPWLCDFADTVLLGVEEIDLEDPHPEDRVHEIADGAVPTYNGPLIETFTEDVGVASWEPEGPPAAQSVMEIGRSVLYDLAERIALAALKERQENEEPGD